MADVSLSRIAKAFGPVGVLHGVSLDIAAGEFVALLGASGCGKTTLLRILAGLETASAGTVSIGGRDVTRLPPERRDLAMMFQSYALLPHLSVAENVRFPLRMRRLGTRREQDERVREALATVHLADMAQRRPGALSGGQQQRVALARAIVSRPRVLLLDEPLSNLDARLREDMQVELVELHRRLGLTTIFVTHDQEEALSLADRVVLLNAGRIEQEGPPREVYSRPASAFASTFFGAANLVPAVVERAGGAVSTRLRDGQSLELSPQEAAQEGSVLLSLRQEDIILGPPGSGPPGRTLRGEVRARVYLGARIRYVLRVGEAQVRALAPADAIFEPGDRVALTVDPARLLVMPEEEGDGGR